MIKSPMRGETPKRGLCVIAVTIPINVGARKAVARPIRPYNPNASVARSIVLAEYMQHLSSIGQ